MKRPKACKSFSGDGTISGLMRAWARLIVLATATATVATAGPAGAGAAAASLQVRVPASRVCINTIGGIKLGVRWNGTGPRRFRVRLYAPTGKVVLARRGLATRAWKRWSYRPALGGVYRTVYTLPGHTRRYRTSSLGCG
jgi:hypothetical protein